MTIYSIFERKPAEVEAVPDRFSWFAACLPPVYALAHGLWWAFAAFAVGLAVLVVASPLIGNDTAVLLYLLCALLFGFEAVTLRRRALIRRGYAYRGERIARDEDDAARSWLDHALARR